MELRTDRLILRPWTEEDAESLYEYAKDELIGPSAGWMPHKSVDESREIIRTVLSAPENYAVCLKDDNKAIGCIGLTVGQYSNLDLPDDEGEIGYWLGVPFWGQGLIPEACREMIRHGFEDMKLKKLWCGYFDGNEKSKRVQEKCGFTYDHTNENIYWKLLDTTVTEHITRLTREQWEKQQKGDIGVKGQKGENAQNYMTEGMCFGMMFGCALGVALNQLAIWMCIGMSLGMSIGLIIKKAK